MQAAALPQDARVRQEADAVLARGQVRDLADPADEALEAGAVHELQLSQIHLHLGDGELERLLVYAVQDRFDAVGDAQIGGARELGDQGPAVVSQARAQLGGLRDGQCNLVHAAPSFRRASKTSVSALTVMVPFRHRTLIAISASAWMRASPKPEPSVRAALRRINVR